MGVPRNNRLFLNFIFRKKIADFDLSLDPSELLSDKRCAPLLSNRTQMYDLCAFKILHNQTKPKKPVNETRVMLRYLKGHENDELLARSIGRGGIWPSR